jgi:hypothetical protein
MQITMKFVVTALEVKDAHVGCVTLKAKDGRTIYTSICTLFVPVAELEKYRLGDVLTEIVVAALAG